MDASKQLQTMTDAYYSVTPTPIVTPHVFTSLALVKQVCHKHKLATTFDASSTDWEHSGDYDALQRYKLHFSLFTIEDTFGVNWMVSASTKYVGSVSVDRNGIVHFNIDVQGNELFSLECDFVPDSYDSAYHTDALTHEERWTNMQDDMDRFIDSALKLSID